VLLMIASRLLFIPLKIHRGSIAFSFS
jgi:hypothetical protein